MKTVVLKGITWNHSRGLLPLQATAQRFAERHPGVEIVWTKRSLAEFEQTPIGQLAKEFDLLVIDHPHIGTAADAKALLPLEEHLPTGFLDDQAAHSVGGSHASYRWAGRQWALAIDAAAPVACWRSDLLERRGLSVPQTWAELMAIAAQGLVELPAAPINNLMNFYALCHALGEAPWSTEGRVISNETGREAFARLAEVIRACAPGCLKRNPIQSLELLTSPHQNTLVYCPLTYGYSNYARLGYADSQLTFGDVVSLTPGHPLKTTLGGTGLALSAHTRSVEWTVCYAHFVASGPVQRTLYCQSGGQPGHRAAWLDNENNRSTNNYFKATLPTLDRAWVRPRNRGYMFFQDRAGPTLTEGLLGNRDAGETLRVIESIHLAALNAD